MTKAADNSMRAHYARMQLNSALSRSRAARERQRAGAEAIADAIAAESGAGDTAA